MNLQISRRDFLRYSTAATVAAFVPARAFGANNKIAVGCIGVGGMGTGNMRNFLTLDDCRVVAVCDTYEDRRQKAKALVDKQYRDTGKRQKNLDEELAQFPYVNGDLFAEPLAFADFNADMRNGLLACCGFQWDTISPAVFGSLFQGIMDSKERRQIGAHYTAEKNILKLIRSLFLDDLRQEFENLKALKIGRQARLTEFQDKLSKLRFFDPACGCGNFLVIAYRELRKLELEVLLERHGAQHEMSLDAVNQLSKLNVHQFYGIEIEEFPARIAEVALWLTDHQANVALSQAFGQMYQRLPLRASPHIQVGNALREDWKKIIAPTECSFILGNPPFVGKKHETPTSKPTCNWSLAT